MISLICELILTFSVFLLILVLALFLVTDNFLQLPESSPLEVLHDDGNIVEVGNVEQPQNLRDQQVVRQFVERSIFFFHPNVLQRDQWNQVPHKICFQVLH